MNSHFWWYTARASGIVAWVLAYISVLWGVLLATRVLKPIDRPAWLLDLHRWVGGLTIAFTGLHMVALALDDYVGFALDDLLVPMASSWNPAPVAWGIVALYGLTAVQVTSLFMRRLPKRFWRAVHISSYGIFAMITVHAITAGTDAGVPWFTGLSTMLAMVGAATAGVRLVQGRFANRPRHTPVGSSRGATVRRVRPTADVATIIHNEESPCQPTTLPPPTPTSSSSWTVPDPWPPSPRTSSAASTPSSPSSRPTGPTPD
jgi:predicted ferric reductase